MDHSMMDHSGMDMGDGDMDHGAMCSMNMLFTWDTTNLCVVFRSWRVTGSVSLVATLLVIVLLTAGYEAVRELARRYESGGQRDFEASPNESDHNTTTTTPTEHRSLLWPTTGLHATRRQKTKPVRAALYAIQVFYSFFIMLLFMTYNGWVMLAVGVGAFVGFLLFGGDEEGGVKSAACH